MRSVFVDTSAFFAFLCASDSGHDHAAGLFARAEAEQWNLHTTSFVVHETSALVQHRLGWEALDYWLDDILPKCQVTWVDEHLARLGMARWQQARSRNLSLTDCVSFAFMKESRLSEALAFDAQFGRHGFACPGP